MMRDARLKYRIIIYKYTDRQTKIKKNTILASEAITGFQKKIFNVQNWTSYRSIHSTVHMYSIDIPTFRSVRFCASHIIMST